MTFILWLLLRSLCTLLVLLPSLSSYAASNSVDPQARFRDIGIMMIVDAVPNAEMNKVIFYNDLGNVFYKSSLVAKHARARMAFPSARVPLTVRVQWREGAGWDKVKSVYNNGIITGDYTIPVAERIPDEVLGDIRRNGGSLRLKFRLKPDGVLFGWDIARDGGGVSKYEQVGGDFLDTKY